MFRDRRSALAASATFGLLAAMELSDFRRSTSASDAVEDEGTTQEFLAAMATAGAVSAVVLHRQRPVPLRRGRWWLGLSLIWGGAALNRAARWELGRNYRSRLTVVDGHEVTATGPYRIVRHPMYTGATVICLGAGTALGSRAAMAAWLLPVAALARRIGVEEAMLRRALGDRYDELMGGRARLVPGLW